ncbi:nicotinate-nucleotide adenylyltransferase [Phenylobacterium sp. LjRoot219]|uniref:nicotinate-nucleotide adenylyltransferase n=1 Tax=Phenylobacterium sp. LjRoot219 TaxID=3342283 RepID=UPI003ED0654D
MSQRPLGAAGRAPRRGPGGRPGALRLGFALSRGQRVGLFGGSFNPAHDGHAHVAETARTRLKLDRVIWLVSPQNPLKSAADTASLAARLDGARRVARGPSMKVSDAETRLGVQYTIDTVRALKARHPGVKFVWIMGADGLAGFHRWRGWAEILREIPVAVIARPGVSLPSRFSPAARRFARFRRPAADAAGLLGAAPPAWVFLTAPLNHESSTDLRALARPAAF